MSRERSRRYTEREEVSEDGGDYVEVLCDATRHNHSIITPLILKEEPTVSRTSRNAPNLWKQDPNSSSIGSRTTSATSRSSSATDYSRLKLNGRLSLHSSNVRGLAGVANKDTISRDSTPDGEVRTANLIAHLGSNVCRPSNMERAEEECKRPRRAAAPMWDTEATQVDSQPGSDAELEEPWMSSWEQEEYDAWVREKKRMRENVTTWERFDLERRVKETEREEDRKRDRESREKQAEEAAYWRRKARRVERRRELLREDMEMALRRESASRLRRVEERMPIGIRTSAFSTNGGGYRPLVVSKPQSMIEELMRSDGDGIGGGNEEDDGLLANFEGARIPTR